MLRVPELSQPGCLARLWMRLVPDRVYSVKEEERHRVTQRAILRRMAADYQTEDEALAREKRRRKKP